MIYLCVLSLDKLVFEKLTLHCYYVQQVDPEYQDYISLDELNEIFNTEVS